MNAVDVPAFNASYYGSHRFRSGVAGSLLKLTFDLKATSAISAVRSLLLNYRILVNHVTCNTEG